jgi:16S rRNA (cytidine1402-2'-O)-methyltransferase
MGILYVVATPIGNLDDITKRAIDTLNSVDLIACEDTRTSGVLLKHFNITKKTVSYHKFNEKGKSNSLIVDLKNGKNIALITDAGCPCISDPGSILVSEAIRNNIEVIAIPGASAVITSLMTSGMDTTSFSFYGFLDRENKKIVESLEKIKSDSTNIAIIYESPKRIIKLLEKVDEVLDNPYISLCNDLTKKFEKKYYGKTKDVINLLNDNANHELGEYVLLIEKNKNKVINEEKVCTESLIINEMINNNCTMKEAIKIVSEKYKINKNEVYNSSLNLKKLFDRK